MVMTCPMFSTELNLPCNDFGLLFPTLCVSSDAISFWSGLDFCGMLHCILSCHPFLRYSMHDTLMTKIIGAGDKWQQSKQFINLRSVHVALAGGCVGDRGY